MNERHSLAHKMVMGVVNGEGSDPDGTVAKAEAAHLEALAEATSAADKIIPPPHEPSLPLMILECMLRRKNTAVLLEEACLALQAMLQDANDAALIGKVGGIEIVIELFALN